MSSRFVYFVYFTLVPLLVIEFSSCYDSVSLFVCVFVLVCMQDKLQSLAGKHSDVLETLTPVVRKRVEALREIQV